MAFSDRLALARASVYREAMPLAYDRKDIARALNVSTTVIRRQERELGLDTARIDVSKKSIRYSEARLKRLKWWRTLNGQD